MSGSEKKSDKKSRSIGKYNIYETLGKGGYSWVKKGEDTETGAVVALKFMNRATDQWALEQAEQVRTEIKSLTQIRHENVMKLYAYNLSAKYPLNEGGFVKTILLVLEHCPGGELFDVLYYADKLEDEIARTYFQQLMYGLQAVHKAGIAHRDLKPQNLLLDANFNLKITDFGLSKIMETEEDRIMKTTYVGTRGYQAPELLKNQKYTNACDIFSSGVVLFILLAGYPPFEAAHKTDKWYRPLAVGDHDKFWHVHRGAKMDDDAKDLIQSMLCYRPSKRISVADIIDHKWFDGKTVDGKKLKAQILIRFLQARENRKKDAKKAEDLASSEHKPEPPKKRSPYDFSLEKTFDKARDKKTPPKIAPILQDAVKDSLSTFYAKKTGYYALYGITSLLEKENKVTVKSADDSWRLECSYVQKVDDQEYEYQFNVYAFHDPKSIHTLIYFKPIKVPDRMVWHRVFRDIMGSLEPDEIFVDNVPKILVDLMNEDKDAPAEEDDSKEAEDDKEDDTAKPDLPRQKTVEADLL